MLKITQKLVYFILLFSLSMPAFGMQRTLQRTACMLRETNLPWKLCAAQFAANTATAILVRKAWKNHPKKPNTPEARDAARSVYFNALSECLRAPENSPEAKRLEEIIKAGTAVSFALIASGALHTFFDQQILSLQSSKKISWKHRLAYFGYNFFGHGVQIKLATALKKSNANPILKKYGVYGLHATTYVQDYYGPALIDQYFIGTSRRSPALRAIYVAQNTIPQYLASKLVP